MGESFKLIAMRLIIRAKIRWPGDELFRTHFKGERVKVLLILNNAPNYPEEFLRQLAQKVNLTVVASPCGPDNLTDPDVRGPYTYYEIRRTETKIAFYQPGLLKVIGGKRWDIVCASANLKNLSVLLAFIFLSNLRRRWLWWGHIVNRKAPYTVYDKKLRLLRRGAGFLVHSEDVADKIRAHGERRVTSFNNTDIKRSDFKAPHIPVSRDQVRFLFVGRIVARKNLDLLIQQARRREDIQVRIVGAGWQRLDIGPEHAPNNVEFPGPLTGNALDEHFEWSHVAVSPGPVGLLVLTAAQHGRGIVLQSDCDHGPEARLANDTGQPRKDFQSNSDIDSLIREIKGNAEILREWANRLQGEAMRSYTIDHMVRAHLQAFRQITSNADTAQNGS